MRLTDYRSRELKARNSSILSISLECHHGIHISREIHKYVT